MSNFFLSIKNTLLFGNRKKRKKTKFDVQVMNNIRQKDSKILLTLIDELWSICVSKIMKKKWINKRYAVKAPFEWWNIKESNRPVTWIVYLVFFSPLRLGLAKLLDCEALLNVPSKALGFQFQDLIFEISAHERLNSSKSKTFCVSSFHLYLSFFGWNN